MNNAQTMKVYAVIAGVDYGGEVFDTLRLFDCWSAADAYREHLVAVYGYDYALMEVREVSFQSSIAA
jgi:hypothetical protein